MEVFKQMREFFTCAIPARAATEPCDRSPKPMLGAVCVAGAVACSSVAGLPPAAQAASGPPAAGKPPVPAHVTDVDSVRPNRHKVIRKRFTPAAKPGPKEVRRIIGVEARRWNISPSSLSRRVACESEYKWYADNGSYQGLLQFGSDAFYRGLSSIRSRKVKFTRERKRMVRAEKVVRYSDGSVKRKPGIKRWQRVVTVYRGTLPRNPPVTHAWTQLRIGAQAIRGISAVSTYEWSCPA